MPPFTSAPAGSAPGDPAVPAADERVPFGEPLPDAPAEPRRRHLRAVPELELDFDAAVRSLTPRLQRYATRRLGDAHEAEELVQEALLRAYQHRGELATEDDVAAWTTCVTGRLVIDRLRVRGRSTPVADVPEGSRVARDTADVVVARDAARTALDALDAMPPRQAAVLWAREVEGLGYEEIGRRFGMTEPAVRSLLTRARKALRKEYEVRGGTLPGAGLAVLAPWVTGTGWLERLRAALVRVGTPAALGIATIGVVTGALVAPSPSAAAPHAAPAVTIAAADRVPEPAPATDPAPAPPVAPPAAPAPTAPATRSGSTSIATGVLRDTGLTSTCVEAGGAGAGGSDCAPEPYSVTLGVDASALPLPEPVQEQLPALQSNAVGCEHLPAVPLTTCSAPREDS